MQEVREDSTCRLRIVNYGFPGPTYRRRSADDCLGDGGRSRRLLRSAGHPDLCLCHILQLPPRPRSEVSATAFSVFASEQYDVSADGKLFLVTTTGEAGTLPLTLVQNWRAELKW